MNKRIMIMVAVMGIALCCLTGCESSKNEKKNESVDDGFNEIVIIDCWGNPV